MSLPTMQIWVAWSTLPFADTPSWTDITADVIAITISRGRQNELARMEAGTATILVDNSSRNYWPDYAGSYSPNVKLRKKVNIQATYGVFTYDLYTGYIEKMTPQWLSMVGGTIPIMQIDCSDAIAIFSRARLNNAGYAEELSGTRIGNVLDDLGFPAADRLIDTGQFTMQATGALSNVIAQQHIYDVCDTEIGLFYQRVDGYMIFEDRSHRTLAPHTVSQATFSDDFFAIAPSLDNELLYNDVRITRVGGTEQTAGNTTSQDDYKLQTLPKTGLLMTTDILAQKHALYLLARYAAPVMRAKTITIKPEKNPATLYPYVLNFEMSTRITMVLTQASINKGYFIEGIKHEYDGRKRTWVTKWQLSDATQYLYPPVAQDEYLRPDGAGDETNLSLFPNGGEANWEDVDEATPDEDTTYVHSPGGALADLYTLGDPTYPVGTINSVTITVRCKQTNTDVQLICRTRIKTNATVYESADKNLTTSYANYTTVYATNPNTSAAWTWAQLNALQAGVRLNAVGTTYGRCTQVFVTVNYTPAW